MVADPFAHSAALPRKGPHTCEAFFVRPAWIDAYGVTLTEGWPQRSKLCAHCTPACPDCIPREKIANRKVQNLTVYYKNADKSAAYDQFVVCQATSLVRDVRAGDGEALAIADLGCPDRKSLSWNRLW